MYVIDTVFRKSLGKKHSRSSIPEKKIFCEISSKDPSQKMKNQAKKYFTNKILSCAIMYTF